MTDTGSDSSASATFASATERNSDALRIFLAVAGGILLGVLVPGGRLGWLSEIGKVAIHWVKLVAGPFLFLTIVASVVEVKISLSHGVRVILIALLNTAIAIVIGMGLAANFLADVRIDSFAAKVNGLPQTMPTDVGLSLSSWLKTFMPVSLFSPFVQNETLLIALMALLFGLALRRIHVQEGESRMRALAETCETWRAVPAQLLRWLIAILPFAVLSVVAGSVSEHGVGVFVSLLQYVSIVILGFVLQIVLVYGFWIFIVAKVRPGDFWRAARMPILYAFGVNSSLAALPQTLKALEGLGVSARSASLGAGVATNLNNDGIVLYEALAVFFVAQLSHVHFGQGQMVAAALACIVASMGITGVPEAGIISLSLVLSTMGLPAEALPLLLSVDWIIARLRSVVNVISDMTLAIALDATESSAERRSSWRRRNP